MSDAAQRATLVLERDAEEGNWYVVAYLVHDSGQRERTTLTWRENREDATVALQEIWNKVLSQRSAFAP